MEVKDSHSQNRVQGFVSCMWRSSLFSRAALLFLLFWFILTLVELGFLISYMHVTQSGNGGTFWWTGTDGPYPPYDQPLAVGLILLGIVAIIAPPRDRQQGVSLTQARAIGAGLAAVGALAFLAKVYSITTPGWLTPVLWAVIGLTMMSASRRREFLDRSLRRIRIVLRR